MQQDHFSYTDERFADLQMLRYKLEGFEQQIGNFLAAHPNEACRAQAEKFFQTMIGEVST